MTYDPMADPPEKIIADAKAYREEAIEKLAAIESGKIIPTDMTVQEAIDFLEENIETYERTMRHYGWRGEGA